MMKLNVGFREDTGRTGMTEPHRSVPHDTLGGRCGESTPKSLSRSHRGTHEEVRKKIYKQMNDLDVED